MNGAGRSRGLLAAMVCVSLSAACLLAGYEFLRSTAASLFIDAYGSGRMPYAMTASPLLMALLIYLYGRMLTRLGPLKSLHVSFLFTGAVLLSCFQVLRAGSKPAVAVLYVFTEAYIVILVEQFWSFINSSLAQDQARLFNGPILGGTAVGPILAGLFVRRHAVSLGSEQMVLLAALSLIPTALLIHAAYRLVGEPRPSLREQGGAFGALHLGLLREVPVLPLIACVVFFTQVFATAVNLRFYQLLEQAMPLKDARTAYLGSFWAAANSVVFVMQFVLTPLLLKRLSLKTALKAVPMFNILAGCAMLIFPSAGMAAVSLALFKGLDYSLFRASKEMIYIPLSYDARYRVKQVVDSFCYRFSKGATAGAFSAGAAAFGALPGPLYPGVALAAACAWLAAAFRLGDKVQGPVGTSVA